MCDLPGAGVVLLLSDCVEPGAGVALEVAADSDVELPVAASGASAAETDAAFCSGLSVLKNDISEEKIESPEGWPADDSDDGESATMSPPVGAPPPSDAKTTLVVAPDAVAAVVADAVVPCGGVPRTDC